MYRIEAIGLQSSNSYYTLKITIFENMLNLGILWKF